MKEIKLKSSDYSIIFNNAHTEWISTSIKPHNECRCIIIAFLKFCKANDYVVKDGKIHKVENEK